MSSFNKQGERADKIAAQKKTDRHVKEFYKIMGEISEIAEQLDPSIEYNEENIDEYVRPIYGRDLDSMEKFLLLGKMQHGEETKDNVK